MISSKCIDAYRKQYGEGTVHYILPDGWVRVLAEGKHYDEPRKKERETDEQFMSRLERSRKCGRNLFAEEWVEFGTYDKDLPKDALL